jgi:hypothetical protein
MTDRYFGAFVLRECNVKRVRDGILSDLNKGGTRCEAMEGFVQSIRNNLTKSRADIRFLEEYDILQKQEKLPIE